MAVETMKHLTECSKSELAACTTNSAFCFSESESQSEDSSYQSATRLYKCHFNFISHI